MTRLEQSSQPSLLNSLFDLVQEHGTDAMSQVFATLLNAAMLAEREAALGAAPYERAESRRGPSSRSTARPRRTSRTGSTPTSPRPSPSSRSRPSTGEGSGPATPSSSSTQAEMEIKRRTRVAGLFPSAESLLRLVSAILSEVDEEWSAGRVYLDLAPKSE